MFIKNCIIVVMYKEIILSKINNIGALTSFLNNNKNIDILNYLNDNIPLFCSNFKITEKLWYFINDVKEPQLCICGQIRSYIGPKNGYRVTCGKKDCFVKKRKETSNENWGVDNPRKSKIINDKIQATIIEKYGEHYMNNEEIRNKFNNTMKKKYGVNWAQQNKEISSKSVETWSNNKNKEHIINKKNDILRNKTEEEKLEINNKKLLTKIEKYGSIENYENVISDKIQNTLIKKELQNPNYKKDIADKRINSYKNTIINKIKNGLEDNIKFISKELNKNGTDSILTFNCLKCNNYFNINRQFFFLRKNNKVNICLKCNPILNGSSLSEKELLDFIIENYKGEIITNTKLIINPLELDIYLPDLKLAFEFNGLYWHSEEYKEKNYHLDKTKKCLENGIQLFHIWEDDWNYKQNIVKSMILNKLGKSNKIYARKCFIKEIDDNKLIREFLETNHIQGFVGSKVKLGLYYNEELVSLMTFGNLRKSMNSKAKEGTYELLRFCNKLNTSVIGGSSKLFSYFIKNYNYEEIISYSDYSRSIGNMYINLGFNFSHLSNPNYYYIIDDKREYRFNFRKDILVKEGFDPNKTEVEIMHDRGYYRLFDCGMQKWIYKK